MFGVIWLHVVVSPLQDLSNIPLWWTANLGAALSAPAVPLFFMISGALLLKDERTSDLSFLFRCRLPKIMVPLCTWSALILVHLFLTDPAAGWEALGRILNNPVAVPYWFLYALVPIYLLSPLLKRMTDHIGPSHWRYMMALWIICTLGLHTLRTFAPPELELTFTEHWTLNLNLVGGYLGYFLLGACLDRLEKLPSPALLASASAAMAAIIALGTWWDSRTLGYYSTRFADYLNLFTFAYAASLFLLCKALFQHREDGDRQLSLLSALSFPVYLMHPLVIGVGKLVWTQLFAHPTPTTLAELFLFFLLACLVCILSGLLLASIPVVCYLFTGQTYRQACSLSNLQALFRGKAKKTD